MIDSDDKTYWCKCFPCLFPFGYGGFDTVRKVQIGFNAWISHLFKLSNFSFMKHTTFVLVPFDALSRKKVSNSKFLTAKIDPDLIPAIGMPFSLNKRIC